MKHIDISTQSVLSQLEWDELHDALELALDALGDGPDDVNEDYLANCIIHQKISLQITRHVEKSIKELW